MAATVPVWTLFFTPASAFVGVVVAQWATRRGAKELERRSRREEVMRTLRWAAELAIDNQNEARARLGVDQLLALDDSDLLDQDGQAFVDAALDTVLYEPTLEVGDNQDAEVIELIIDESPTLTEEGHEGLPLIEGPREPEGGTDG
jgi:hypothetical protein